MLLLLMVVMISPSTMHFLLEVNHPPINTKSFNHQLMIRFRSVAYWLLMCRGENKILVGCLLSSFSGLFCMDHFQRDFMVYFHFSQLNAIPFQVLFSLSFSINFHIFFRWFRYSLSDIFFSYVLCTFPALVLHLNEHSSTIFPTSWVPIWVTGPQKMQNIR